MSANREIKNKIKSIESTKKITSAMQLVSASKMKKAQDVMAQARPYTQELQSVVDRLMASDLGVVDHTYFQHRPLKKICYIVLSSKRGLCGSLNLNLFKKLLGQLVENDAAGIESCAILIGQKATNFFKDVSLDVLAQLEPAGDTPSLEELVSVLGVALAAFQSGDIDGVFLVYNFFKNSMIQNPSLEMLLPFAKPVQTQTEKTEKISWEYLYDTAPHSVLDVVLTRCLEAKLYQAVLENFTSEQAARMMAMKAATDNASSMIDELRLIFNKTRQAAITQEIIEIVSGASAIM